jgi:hypothetical protein
MQALEGLRLYPSGVTQCFVGTCMVGTDHAGEALHKIRPGPALESNSYFSMIYQNSISNRR